MRDIGWFRPDGELMSDEDWRHGFAKSLGVFLNGDAMESLDERGEPIVDDSFYVLFNAHHEPLAFRLPDGAWAESWVKVLDTGEDPPPGQAAGQPGSEGEPRFETGGEVPVEARSLVLLRQAG